MGSSHSSFRKIEDSTEREERNLRNNPDDLFEKCSELQRKLERSKKIEMAGAADEVLMPEIAEYKTKKERLQETNAMKPAFKISPFNISNIGRAASEKSSFNDTCLSAKANKERLVMTYLVDQKATKSVTTDSFYLLRKHLSRVSVPALSLNMEPYGTFDRRLEEAQSNDDFFGEPFRLYKDKMQCLVYSLDKNLEREKTMLEEDIDILLAVTATKEENIRRRTKLLVSYMDINCLALEQSRSGKSASIHVTTTNETQDVRDKYYRAFSAEPLMIRQIEPEMFQWYTRRKELQIYHEKNSMQGIDFLCFFEEFNALPVKESRSDNNGDRKLEILKEKRRELDKEIKENLQQCILLLIGMRRRNQMQKRQVATI